MKCINCKYYYTTEDYNQCNLIGFENFYELDDCKLVFEDNEINYREYSWW